MNIQLGRKFFDEASKYVNDGEQQYLGEYTLHDYAILFVFELDWGYKVVRVFSLNDDSEILVSVDVDDGTFQDVLDRIKYLENKYD